ncbi:MAG: HNH endonuclease [Phycisphaeraceae bacterium]|nr:HNH endonuclease [Phycisphaeraceae bacterium]
MVGTNRNWTREELLLAFRLYCRTPFGRLHQHNPDIIALVQRLGRTPSAVGMKACNFASLDPAQQARNITALGNVSRADRILWDEFAANPEAIAAEAEAACARLAAEESQPDIVEQEPEVFPEGPTETERTIRARRVQSFFRAAVLTSYDHRCALSGLAVPELLNASHIIPWSVSIERRADPRNGICLNALYDRSFNRGLITFDEDLRVVVSDRLRVKDPPPLHREALLGIHGQTLRIPPRFMPDQDAIAYHRQQVFI